jgi:hypothetical protein
VAHQTDPTPRQQPPTFDTAELEALPNARVVLRRRLSPRWAFFSFAVLGLLGVTLWLRYTAPLPAPAASTPEPRPTSIAVLPLVNASPDSANEYFSDGMTEELTAALGRVPGLRVAAPSPFLFSVPAQRSRTPARPAAASTSRPCSKAACARPTTGSG